MQETIIVLYENNELIIQTTQLISEGVFKLIDRNNYGKVIVENEITNTDFIRIHKSLLPGKYEIRIIVPTTTITKRITVG